MYKVEISKHYQNNKLSFAEKKLSGSEKIWITTDLKCLGITALVITDFYLKKWKL